MFLSTGRGEGVVAVSRVRHTVRPASERASAESRCSAAAAVGDPVVSTSQSDQHFALFFFLLPLLDLRRRLCVLLLSPPSPPYHTLCCPSAGIGESATTPLSHRLSVCHAVVTTMMMRLLQIIIIRFALIQERRAPISHHVLLHSHDPPLFPHNLSQLSANQLTLWQPVLTHSGYNE